MKTYLECIPCFFKQIIQASDLIGFDNQKARNIINRTAQLVPVLDTETSPPAMSREIYEIIKQETGISDPYKKIKDESNRKALAVFPLLKKTAKEAADPLLKAVELSIAGNIIDFGANTELDIDNEIKIILETTESRIKQEEHRFFNFTRFRKSLEKAESLLFLADNAGEIVFDRILLEQIQDSFPKLKIKMAVRGEPIINDCTMNDIQSVGIPESINIISNGSNAPGTILDICSQEFLEAWKQSDMIISKGQGNYETLSEERRDIHFLLIAKCSVITRHVGCTKGDILLLSGD